MSLMGSIVSACVDVIKLAAPGTSVILRKPIAVMESDAKPMVLVTHGKEALIEEVFGRKRIYDYTVDVIVVSPRADDLETGLGPHLALRSAIRAKLYDEPMETAQILSAVPQVWDLSVQLDPPFDDQMALKGYAWAALRITYRTQES